jgi:hypothetical protein
MARVPDTIKRGRLTPDEFEKIDALAGRGLTPGQIALRLNRHPGTVNYAMHRLGHRKLTRRSTTYTRNGVVVKPFSAEEDAFIQALRVQDFSTAKIADLVGKRFGHPRTPHTINIRLIMLASAAEAA